MTIDEILGELDELGKLEEPTEDDATRVDELIVLAEEIRERDAKRAERETRITAVREAYERGDLNVEHCDDDATVNRDVNYDSDPLAEPAAVRDAGVFSDPWDVDVLRAPTSEVRARAASVLERSQGMTDTQRESNTQVMERFDDERGEISRFIVGSSKPAAASVSALGRPSAELHCRSPCPPSERGWP